MPPKHLLIIDDDDHVREVVSMTLQESDGWTTTVAPSGAAGLALARTVHPDAILLDVMMPGLDGPGTFRFLQADLSTKAIPVIFLTAKQGIEHRKFLALGLRGIISKPFDPVLLGKEIRETLGWPARAAA
jgi:CheY-like chemotaxis protein